MNVAEMEKKVACSSSGPWQITRKWAWKARFCEAGEIRVLNQTHGLGKMALQVKRNEIKTYLISMKVLVTFSP